MAGLRSVVRHVPSHGRRGTVPCRWPPRPPPDWLSLRHRGFGAWDLALHLCGLIVLQSRDRLPRFSLAAIRVPRQQAQCADALFLRQPSHWVAVSPTGSQDCANDPADASAKHSRRGSSDEESRRNGASMPARLGYGRFRLVRCCRNGSGEGTKGQGMSGAMAPSTTCLATLPADRLKQRTCHAPHPRNLFAANAD